MMNRADVLVALINEHDWSIGAEIGLLKCHTTETLLSQCPDLHLYGVDPMRHMPNLVYSDGGTVYNSQDWDANYAKVQQLEKRYDKRFHFVRKTSMEAVPIIADCQLDFVFIDADHQSRSVGMDMLGWATKLKPTGWLMGHDTHFTTVRVMLGRLLDDKWVEHRDHVWSIPRSEIGWLPE